jgi:hypothetical protein
MIDQYLIASLALVALMAFIAFAYIVNEERKSRILIERPSEPDTIETRSRRAF